jgi:hypothetical protein
MSDPSIEWWKVWFFLRNDATTLLSVFTGSHPVPQPNLGMVWPRHTSVSYNPCVMLSKVCYEVG